MIEVEVIPREIGEKPVPLRVLAGFGSLADELPTIDAAMALARALEAEIAGCFVEDADLLNLAGLPFAKAIRLSDRSVQRIEREQMQRLFSRAAANCQRNLLAKSSHLSVRCSFKIMRGTYSTEIAREAVARDVVVINPANLPNRAPNAVTQLCRSFEGALGTVIVPERGPWRPDGPVVVMTTGPNVEQSILTIAHRMARAADNSLFVITTGVPESDQQRFRAEVTEVLGVGANIRFAAEIRIDAAAAQLARMRPSFVVLQPFGDKLSDSLITQLLESGRAPLMLMRKE